MTMPPDLHAAPTTLFLERARRLVGRIGWGIADQALSSLTNFAIGIFVARLLGIEEFGAFSLAFITYQLALNASRGIATEPLVVRYSAAEPSARRQATRKATGMATAFGVVLGACCVGIGMLLPGSLRMAFVPLGMMLPGLLLQDSWRFAFFAAGRGSLAFVNDLVWAIAMIPAFVIAMAAGHTDLFWLVLAWGASALVAAVFGVIQTRFVPRPLDGVEWLRENHDLALRYLGENLTLISAIQLRSYGLGLIAGLASLGAIRAAELLLGPVNVVSFGMANIAVPEAVRLMHRSISHLRSFCLLVAGGLSGVAIVVGTIMLLLPTRFGYQLLGSSWEPAHRLLVPVSLTAVNTGLSIAAITGLRALSAASTSLRARLVASSASSLGGLLGAALGGASGAAWGVFIGSSIGVGNWWWQLRKELRKHETRSDGASQVKPSPLSPRRWSKNTSTAP
jgi:O-antigen/teichoic acid export membrane protein